MSGDGIREYIKRVQVPMITLTFNRLIVFASISEISFMI